MKTLIRLPVGEKHEPCFQSSVLSMRTDGQIEFMQVEQTLIYEARNIIGKYAAENEFDRIFFLDCDIEFEPDVMKRLAAHMDKGLDMVTGLYVSRKTPIKATIFSEITYKELEDEEGAYLPVATYYEDYPKDQLFEIAGAGMGCCMITVDLIKRVQQRFGVPFSPLIGFGEDLSFCRRAKDLGAHIWCDSSIKLKHCGKYMYTEKDIGVL